MTETLSRLALLPTNEPRLPDLAALVRSYRKAFPDAGTLTPDATEEADALLLHTPTVRFRVALVQAPVPAEELSEPCSAAWYWPEAEAALRGHGSQLAVTATSAHEDAIGLMLALTRVVAATLDVSTVCGVFLPGAHQVHKPEDFVSEAANATREQLPLYLWVRFTMSEEPDGRMTLCTSGLGDLALMEVEFPRARLDPQTLMDRAFNIAHYLLDHGPVLAHGHTIGISAEERFKVSHAPSLRSGTGNVYRLEEARGGA